VLVFIFIIMLKFDVEIFLDLQGTHNCDGWCYIFVLGSDMLFPLFCLRYFYVPLFLPMVLPP